MSTPAPTRGKTGVSIKRTEGPDPGFEAIRAKDPVTIVIFGASGDLAKRKLIPALYHLHAGGYLPGALRGRRLLAHADERRRLPRAPCSRRCREQVKGDSPRRRRTIRSCRRCYYQPGDADDPAIVSRR